MEWISIKEQKPKSNEYVLVWKTFWEIPAIAIFTPAKNWHCEGRFYTQEEIEFWKSVEPPKDKE